MLTDCNVNAPDCNDWAYSQTKCSLTVMLINISGQSTDRHLNIDKHYTCNTIGIVILKPGKLSSYKQLIRKQ